MSFGAEDVLAVQSGARGRGVARTCISHENGTSGSSFHVCDASVRVEYVGQILQRNGGGEVVDENGRRFKPRDDLLDLETGKELDGDILLNGAGYGWDVRRGLSIRKGQLWSLNTRLQPHRLNNGRAHACCKRRVWR